MNRLNRFLPIAAFAVAMTLIVTLQSCGKKEEKPQSAEQKVENAMSGQQQAAPGTPAATPAPDAAAGLNDNAKKGMAIFYNASFGKKRVACATCHSDGSASTKDGKTRAGHTLAGVTNRTATWNGMYKAADLKKNAYGAMLCASGFQERGSTANALSADEANQLDEYLMSIADAPGAMKKNLTIQWVLKPIFDENQMLDGKLTKPAVKAIMKLAGDPGKGEAVWTATCATCHDMQNKKVGPPMVKAAQDINNVAQSIRCGAMAMPFFAKDVLSDQQVSDVIAYIQTSIKK
jgi:mono/diheme cytochrome c family protein